MSNRELWQPHVMGQIMLLFLVTSHELSYSISLAGRRTLFWRGSSLWSNMRSSRLNRVAVTVSRIGPSDYPHTFLQPVPPPSRLRGALSYRCGSRSGLLFLVGWGGALPPLPDPEWIPADPACPRHEPPPEWGGVLAPPPPLRRGTPWWVFPFPTPPRSPLTPGEAMDPTPHPFRGGGSVGGHHYVSSPAKEGDD